MLHGAVAVLLLLVAATLSVYKPQGMTGYGWRKQHEQRKPSGSSMPATIGSATE